MSENAPKCPCIGCAERKVGCHGQCVKYKVFRLSLDKKARQMRKEYAENASVTLRKSAVVKKAIQHKENRKKDGE